MLDFLKRHPVPIKTVFEHSLMLTYAFPQEVLAPLLPPGLELDVAGEYGFLALGTGKTCSLRPAFLPAFCGQSFFLTGYRVFARFRHPDGRLLRGLFILRSDTDSRLMAAFGNLLTRYQFWRSEIDFTFGGNKIRARIKSPDGYGDLDLSVDIGQKNASLPQGSPFKTIEEAHNFAGPLTYTFDYEERTNSIVIVEGVHEEWQRQPIVVESIRSGFLHQPCFFLKAKPVLASAFYVRSSPYAWRRGKAHRLAVQL